MASLQYVGHVISPAQIRIRSENQRHQLASHGEESVSHRHRHGCLITPDVDDVTISETEDVAHLTGAGARERCLRRNRHRAIPRRTCGSSHGDSILIESRARIVHSQRG